MFKSRKSSSKSATPPGPPSPAGPAPVAAARAPKTEEISYDNDEDGAKPSEILIEAARRNNVDLLQEVLGIGADGTASSKATDLINTSVDALGNTALHVAALNGSYECLDVMLDVEGVEVDPLNRMQGNTPLHCAVIYSEEEPEHAISIVDMLIDAGSDPRIRNKQKDKPIDLVPGTNPELRKALQGAEMATLMGPVGAAEEEGQDVEDSGSESD
ncbi:ankyrin repeat-containing domain protein [Kockiozyma suomiensis]|uniref:ankyrin repeat-containing domain protein n=1 Tax=Kockiozyma suomiensis TaxID=1337062 RepID=UPI0033435BAF